MIKQLFITLFILAGISRNLHGQLTPELCHKNTVDFFYQQFSPQLLKYRDEVLEIFSDREIYEIALANLVLNDKLQEIHNYQVTHYEGERMQQMLDASFYVYEIFPSSGLAPQFNINIPEIKKKKLKPNFPTLYEHMENDLHDLLKTNPCKVEEFFPISYGKSRDKKFALFNGISFLVKNKYGSFQKAFDVLSPQYGKFYETFTGDQLKSFKLEKTFPVDTLYLSGLGLRKGKETGDNKYDFENRSLYIQYILPSDSVSNAAMLQFLNTPIRRASYSRLMIGDVPVYYYEFHNPLGNGIHSTANAFVVTADGILRMYIQAFDARELPELLRTAVAALRRSGA